MKSVLAWLITCGVLQAQPLTFVQNTLDHRVAGLGDCKVYEDNAEKDTDYQFSVVPALGSGHGQGLVSSGNNVTYASWNNADGLHEAKVTNAAGWVLSSTITNPVTTAFVQAASTQKLFCKSPGIAPKVTRCEAIARASAIIAREYDITDNNRGSAQLVRATITVKSVYSQTGLYSNHCETTLTGTMEDSQVLAVSLPEGWVVYRQLRTSTGAWENPTPPHIIEVETGKNLDLTYTCYALVNDAKVFTAGVMNTNSDGNPHENSLDGTSLINGVSGQNPNVTENLEPLVRVNIVEITKAF